MTGFVWSKKAIEAAEEAAYAKKQVDVNTILVAAAKVQGLPDMAAENERLRKALQEIAAKDLPDLVGKANGLNELTQALAHVLALRSLASRALNPALNPALTPTPPELEEAWAKKFYIGSAWKTRCGKQVTIIRHDDHNAAFPLVGRWADLGGEPCFTGRGEYKGIDPHDYDLVEPWSQPDLAVGWLDRFTVGSLWRLRDGRMMAVTSVLKDNKTYQIAGRIEGRDFSDLWLFWHRSGAFDIISGQTDFDIVGPWVEPTPVPADPPTLTWKQKYAIGSTWRTRDGQRVTIARHNGPSSFPVIGRWDHGGVPCFTTLGKYVDDGSDHDHDLVEPWEAKAVVETCGNCRFNHNGLCHGMPPKMLFVFKDANGDTHYECWRPGAEDGDPACSLWAARAVEARP